jgi:hypothetical protein
MAQQLVASTVSQALALAQPGAVRIFNYGPQPAYVVAGDDTVVATAAGTMLVPGISLRVGAPGGYLAAICDAGSATLDISAVAAASNGSQDYLPSTGGTLSGGLSMSNNSITDLADPVDDADAATKGYVDTALAPLLLRIAAVEAQQRRRS